MENHEEVAEVAMGKMAEVEEMAMGKKTEMHQVWSDSPSRLPLAGHQQETSAGGRAMNHEPI